MDEKIAVKEVFGVFVDNPFSSSSTTSDVVLVVEGRKLHVSKAILADVSPVFERMFYGDFKEKKSSKVTLPGKKYDEMVEFLLGIYPSKMKKVSKETVEAVMLLADEYQVKHIIEDCTQFLTRSHTDVEVSEMVHFLYISENKVQLQTVYDYFLDKVARNYSFKDRTEKSEFDEISIWTRYKVLRKRVDLFETDYSFHVQNMPDRITASSFSGFKPSRR